MPSGDYTPNLSVRSPRSETAGRRFEPVRELELTDAARHVIESLPRASSGITVLREALMPYGMPDFTALVGPKERLQARKRLAVPPILNQLDAALIAAAAVRRRYSTETLARRSSLPKATVERRLPDLLSNRALLKVGNAYVRPPGLVPIGRLYAIEMKINGWQRGIYQCRRYAVWADSYVLVMNSLSGRSEQKVVEAVRGDGGGLVVDGRFLLRPRITAPSPATRLLASEYFLSSL